MLYNEIQIFSKRRTIFKKTSIIDADENRNNNNNDYLNKLSIMNNNNIVSKGTKINLQNIYRAESLAEMDGKFNTYKQIYDFVKDFSYNQTSPLV